MLISEKLATFIQGPTFTRVGTRDATMNPTLHFAAGVRVADDRQHLTVIIPEVTAHGLRENLADNGQIAITSGEAVSHETYQLKGKCTAIREATPEDLAAQERWGAGLADYLTKYKFPADFIATMMRVRLRPSVAVTFRVDEIFDQKPGPAAGGRIES